LDEAGGCDVFGDAPSQNGAKALVLSILTAVCAALLGTAADAPSGVRLLLLVLGAAIPPLVLHVGPWQGVRTLVAFAITGVALFVAYGGFAIFAFASHRPSALPLPPSLPNPSDGQTTTTTPPTTTTSGPGIDVTPDSVHCDINGCDHSVTITSKGDDVLKITKIEFDPASGEFVEDGKCEWHDLMKDERCEVEVTFVPSGAAGTHYAQMVIHQNLPGKPTYVALEGKVEKPMTAGLEFDLDLVGSIPFADRYKVDVSIDGTSYTEGFCGYGDASTRCTAGKLYTWVLPSVRVGANLRWQFYRTGLSTVSVAQGDSTLSQATRIAVRCTYTGSQTGTPYCMRTN
jgi:hypothetical protein